jgi:hypothetical protein
MNIFSFLKIHFDTISYSILDSFLGIQPNVMAGQKNFFDGFIVQASA